MDSFGSDSDLESYTETSESEYQDDTESSYSGHAQNILSSLDLSIGKIDNFLAYERVFSCGDVVCSVEDPSGQLGRVLDMDIIVDLEESTGGHLVKDVNSKKLLKVKSFASGDYVVSDSWLGRVSRVIEKIAIMFSNGTKCEITAGDMENLMLVTPSVSEDSPYPYYPGQRVRIKHPTLSKTARWLCGSWKEEQDEGTICHVEVGLVHVNWITSVLIHCGITPPRPACVQDPRALTLLSCLPHANWQLGDWCTLPDDYLHDIQHFVPYSIAKVHEDIGTAEHRFKKMFVVAKTKTNVDVLWQDGTMTVGLDPHRLLPVNSVSDYDFWPYQCVLEKVTSEDVNVKFSQRFGIVKKVDSLERTVEVKWIDPDLKEIGNREDTVEVVSAYELIEHPNWTYSIGDIVFRVLPQGKLEKSDLEGQDIRHLEKCGSGYVENSKYYLPCIGNVVGFKGETIEVRWASGLISKVKPSEILGLDVFDDPSRSPAIPENWSTETVEQDEQSSEKEKAFNDFSEYQKKETWASSALCSTRTAVGFLSHVANMLFASRGSAAPSSSLSEAQDLQPLNSGELIIDMAAEAKQKTNAIAYEVKEEDVVFSTNHETLNFKKFDVVGDYSDHHFINSIDKRLPSCQVKRGWFKKIQQEWSILKKDLPDGIQVRVYEERIDILRASIAGTEGTPYHDGLFFFDILFPPDYPNEPPMVHYKSGGLRLNPNLYDSGKVCLSLLKTWTGAGNEVWNPESSTILQVLLSLQALVLNAKPYFNEAGYDKQIGSIEGEKNSVTYNENAFILSCKTMLYHLRKPPKHFEGLVGEHFARRADHIMRACMAYMDGAQVGCPFERTNVGGEGKRSSSTGFKIMLSKLFPMLISGFTDNGIDCSHNMEPVSSGHSMA